MDRVTIIKELTNSFRVIDCQWEDMKESLTLCILKIAEYDLNKAFDLWCTLLIRNKRRLRTHDAAKELIDNFFYKLSSFLYKDFFDYSSGNHFLIEKIVPQMQNKFELLDIIYGETYCAGTAKSGWENSCLYCFVDIILLGDTDIIKRIISKLICNNYMNDITIGDYLLKVSNLLNEIFDDEDYPNYNTLDMNIKNMLLDLIYLLLNNVYL